MDTPNVRSFAFAPSIHHWIVSLNPIKPPLSHGFPMVFTKLSDAGYPLVDACMRELSITGYASNHARLNAASFLAYTMSFDWRQRQLGIESLRS